MNIILGASGRVGSMLVNELRAMDMPVRAVVRSKNEDLEKKAEVRYADYRNRTELTAAMAGGQTAFLLTPENPASNNILEETKQLIANYQSAIRENQIQKIIGLSCVGAHVQGNTGNILMSRMLEEAFDGDSIQKGFIRPSYYFSNWLGFMHSKYS